MAEESGNITQTIETLYACDTPPSENNIDKLLSDGIVPNKYVNETTIEINPNFICKNVFCDVIKNRFQNLVEE